MGVRVRHQPRIHRPELRRRSPHRTTQQLERCRYFGPLVPAQPSRHQLHGYSAWPSPTQQHAWACTALAAFSCSPTCLLNWPPFMVKRPTFLCVAAASFASRRLRVTACTVRIPPIESAPRWCRTGNSTPSTTATKCETCGGFTQSCGGSAVASSFCVGIRASTTSTGSSARNPVGPSYRGSSQTTPAQPPR